MNQLRNRSNFPAGDFISERAVRGALGRRRRAANSVTPDHLTGSAESAAAVRSEGAGSPGRGVLRRWSVAELIANAAAVRPADPISCG